MNDLLDIVRDYAAEQERALAEEELAREQRDLRCMARLSIAAEDIVEESSLIDWFPGVQWDIVELRTGSVENERGHGWVTVKPAGIDLSVLLTVHINQDGDVADGVILADAGAAFPYAGPQFVHRITLLGHLAQALPTT